MKLIWSTKNTHWLRVGITINCYCFYSHVTTCSHYLQYTKSLKCHILHNIYYPASNFSSIGNKNFVKCLQDTTIIIQYKRIGYIGAQPAWADGQLKIGTYANLIIRYISDAPIQLCLSRSVAASAKIFKLFPQYRMGTKFRDRKFYILILWVFYCTCTEI